MDTTLFLLVPLSALILLIEHWFPYWDQVLGRKLVDMNRAMPDPVRTVVNYVAGTMAWFGMFSIWLVLRKEILILLAGWIFLSVSGLAVIFAYWYDYKVNTAQRAKEMEEELHVAKARLQQGEHRAKKPD